MRRLPEKLARKAATAYGLSAATLPVNTNWVSVQPRNEDTLAADSASLGYPGFSYLRSRPKKNPVEVLLSALSAKSLDSRLTEALPCVLLKYPDLDWQSLVNLAKVRDLQNKLGSVTSVARWGAEKRRENDTSKLLRKQELVLEIITHCSLKIPYVATR